MHPRRTARLAASKTQNETRGALSNSHRRRPSRGILRLEQEAERRLLEKQWSGTSVMRGCTPLRLQWVRGTSQWWLSFPSPPFRGHFCPSQWAFCPLPAFCQRLTLRVCSFFCLLFLSPPQNKTRPETATIHSPPSASVLHRDFCLPLWLRPVLVARICTKFFFFSRRPLPLPCALAETNVRPPEDGGDSPSRWCTNRNEIKASQSGALLVPPQI